MVYFMSGKSTFRLLVCALLIVINILYAFENHDKNSDSSSNISSQLSIGMDCHDTGCVPQAQTTHNCHLGHCSFILAASGNINSINHEAHLLHAYTFQMPWNYLDPELEPPIRS